jgi:hypothetical protein
MKTWKSNSAWECCLSGCNTLANFLNLFFTSDGVQDRSRFNTAKGDNRCNSPICPILASVYALKKRGSNIKQTYIGKKQIRVTYWERETKNNYTHRFLNRYLKNCRHIICVRYLSTASLHVLGGHPPIHDLFDHHPSTQLQPPPPPHHSRRPRTTFDRGCVRCDCLRT